MSVYLVFDGAFPCQAGQFLGAFRSRELAAAAAHHAHSRADVYEVLLDELYDDLPEKLPDHGREDWAAKQSRRVNELIGAFKLYGGHSDVDDKAAS